MPNENKEIRLVYTVEQAGALVNKEILIIDTKDGATPGQLDADVHGLRTAIDDKAIMQSGGFGPAIVQKVKEGYGAEVSRYVEAVRPLGVLEKGQERTQLYLADLGTLSEAEEQRLLAQAGQSHSASRLIAHPTDPEASAAVAPLQWTGKDFAAKLDGLADADRAAFKGKVNTALTNSQALTQVLDDYMGHVDRKPPKPSSGQRGVFKVNANTGVIAASNLQRNDNIPHQTLTQQYQEAMLNAAEADRLFREVTQQVHASDNTDRTSLTDVFLSAGAKAAALNSPPALLRQHLQANTRLIDVAAPRTQTEKAIYHQVEAQVLEETEAVNEHRQSRKSIFEAEQAKEFLLRRFDYPIDMKDAAAAREEFLADRKAAKVEAWLEQIEQNPQQPLSYAGPNFLPQALDLTGIRKAPGRLTKADLERLWDEQASVATNDQFDELTALALDEISTDTFLSGLAANTPGGANSAAYRDLMAEGGAYIQEKWNERFKQIVNRAYNVERQLHAFDVAKASYIHNLRLANPSMTGEQAEANFNQKRREFAGLLNELDRQRVELLDAQKAKLPKPITKNMTVEEQEEQKKKREALDEWMKFQAKEDLKDSRRAGLVKDQRGNLYRDGEDIHKKHTQPKVSGIGNLLRLIKNLEDNPHDPNPIIQFLKFLFEIIAAAVSYAKTKGEKVLNEKSTSADYVEYNFITGDTQFIKESYDLMRDCMTQDGKLDFSKAEFNLEGRDCFGQSSSLETTQMRALDKYVAAAAIAKWKYDIDVEHPPTIKGGNFNFDGEVKKVVEYLKASQAALEKEKGYKPEDAADVSSRHRAKASHDHDRMAHMHTRTATIHGPDRQAALVDDEDALELSASSASEYSSDLDVSTASDLSSTYSQRAPRL